MLRSPRLLRPGVLAGLLGLTALACGGGGASPDASTGADATPGPVTVDASDSTSDAGTDSGLRPDIYLDRFLAGSCAWFLRCEPKIGAVAFGQVLCHPIRRSALKASFLSLLDSGAVSFDADTAARCLAMLDAAECNVADLDLALCDAAFVGQSGPGEACVTGLACAEGECVVGASCPGSCVAVAEGGACRRARECASGLACVGGVCAPPRVLGERCERRTDCASGLVCAGRCVAPPGLGEPCSRGVGGDLCAADRTCIDGACAAASALGEACDDSTPCAPGGRCIEGVCVPTAVAGEPCVTGGCLALHACVGGVCQPMGTAGDACSDALPCVEGACRDGVCELLADGESCAADVQFGECRGLCVGGTCRPRVAEGGACRGSSQCEAGFVCREVSGPASCQPACFEGVAP